MPRVIREWSAAIVQRATSKRKPVANLAVEEAGGGIQPIGYVILAVVAVVLIVAIVAAAWWHFFGGAKAATDAATEELFDLLDENANGLIDAQELHALVDLYLEETCDDDGKAAARACMEELRQSAPNTDPEHMTLSQFRDFVQSGKLAHVMMRLKNIKATIEQREKLALQARVEVELEAALSTDLAKFVF